MTIFYEFVWDFGIEFVSINSPLTISKMTFHWIRVYLPFEVSTTHHWCSNSICPQGRRFATTFWTLHRVFTRPWQKSVARVHHPVASASGIWFLWARCLESWVLTLDNPRCFVFSSPAPPRFTNVHWRLSHTSVWRASHRHSDWSLSYGAPVLADTIWYQWFSVCRIPPLRYFES